MFDQDLFIQKMIFEKTADDKILTDANSWEQDIMKALYEQAPYLGQYGTLIKFIKRDDERGYAFGQIIVNSSLTIPFIISNKNGKSTLSSLDMFNFEGEWHPLTSERVERILFNHQIFDRVARPDEEAIGTGRQIGILDQPPDSGREILASVAPRAILQDVLASASRDDIKSVLDEIDADEKIAAGFMDNGTFSAIRKIAAEYIKPQDEDKMINQQLPTNIIEVEKVGSKYRITAISDSLYRPVVKELDLITLRKLGADALIKAASEDQVIFEMNRKPSEAFIVEDVNSGLKPIEKTGFYNVGGKDGLVYDTVDFSLVNTGNKLFTSGNEFAYQEKLAYNELKTNELVKQVGDIQTGLQKSEVNDAFEAKTKEKAECNHPDKATEKAEGKQASLGDWVTFVISPVGEHGIATEPVKLSSMASIDERGVKLAAERADGRKITLILTPDVKTFIEKDGVYYIPACDPLPLGKRITVEHDIRRLDDFDKMASKTHNTVEVLWSGLEYVIRGMDECEKLGTTHGVTKQAARLALVNLGTTVKEADLILKRASLHRKINVSGLNNLITEKMIKSAYRSDKAKELKQNTVKLAAMLPTEDSVDAVLSLNFINPLNLREFIDFIPTFEQSISHLCQLLLAARMGLKEMDEYAIKTAITVLEKITTDLKGMFTVVDTLQSISGDM